MNDSLRKTETNGIGEAFIPQWNAVFDDVVNYYHKVFVKVSDYLLKKTGNLICFPD